MSKQNPGFSLIEIMIVVAIIMIILSLIGPMAMKRYGKAQEMGTRAVLSQIKEGLQQYRMDIGNFPRQEQGLKVLVEPPLNQRLAEKWDGPYIDTKLYDEEQGVVVDKWNNEIIYNNPAQRHKEYRYFELISLGADGAEGGADSMADIHDGA